MMTVLTCITGYYDNLRPPEAVNPDVEYLCFADEPMPTVPPWKIQPVPHLFNGDMGLTSRIPKLLPHVLADADYSVWIDGCFTLKIDPVEMTEWIRNADVAMFKHPCRDCIYEEAEICLREKIGNPQGIKKQILDYRKHGIPEHIGLFAGGVIVRRHTDRVKEFNEIWWGQQLKYRSGRDQLGLTYARLETQMPIKKIEGGHVDNKFVTHHFHAGFLSQSDNEKYVPIQEKATWRRLKLRKLCEARYK